MKANDSIESTVQIWKDGDQFIAHAMPLDVTSSGRTPDEARRALDEAVRLYLVTSAEHGKLPDVLVEAGYTFREGRWESPAWVSVERHLTTFVAPVHDPGPQAPTNRGDEYHPAPDYWKVVQARRPLPHQIIETLTDVPVHLAPPQQPPLRLAEVDESFFDDEADVLVL